MPDEFEDMTWGNYQRLLFNFFKKEANQWEHTRATLSYINNVNVSKKSQMKKPKEIMPLWTDKFAIMNRVPKKLTSNEEKEEILKKLQNGKREINS